MQMQMIWVGVETAEEVTIKQGPGIEARELLSVIHMIWV